MKISRDGPLPQFELGPHLGGFKVLYQRSGIIARMITMTSAMTAAWSTNQTLRDVFLGSFLVFMAAAGAVLCLWMVFDYVALMPSEQNFRQGQAHRSERSPLKRDTERILDELDETAVADGGENCEQDKNG